MATISVPILWFVKRNCILYNEDCTKRIGSHALVALTLMIAESKDDGENRCKSY